MPTPRHHQFSAFAVVLCLFSTSLMACSAGGRPIPTDGSGIDTGVIDSGLPDAATADAMPDASLDANLPDTMPDGPVAPTPGICDPCETHDECGAGNFCVNLTIGGKACVPGCVADIPTCPRNFSCVLDVTSGADTTVCLPIGGSCCVDEDADGYGQGIGCMDRDCDDMEPTTYPGAPELCNGVDDDCDEMPDDPPTDCMSGRCTIEPTGSYETVSDAECRDRMCFSGMLAECGLYTCSLGGEEGDSCATLCANADGADDERFCVEAAHCDDSACLPDVPNGMACDEDSDCVSAHCDNGFCCDSGICCGATTDCPGGGSMAAICDDPMTCQGTRGETTCTASECRAMTGIPDDAGCTSMTLALECGLYAPIYCTGEADQVAPTCPTRCTEDSECIDSAHCEAGFCLPDRTAGAPCTEVSHCEMGLFCTDGVCCSSTCEGTCVACNVPGAEGRCSSILIGNDPARECPGFSCTGYYMGFDDSAGDRCFHRADVSDEAAGCNGAGACVRPSDLCPAQPAAGLQLDCDDSCQTPDLRTCAGRSAGVCTNLDDAADRVSCGTGSCMTNVQRCVGGTLRSCVPLTPSAEVCDGADNNCNGTPDDGPTFTLCPATASVTGTVCSMGSCGITSCSANAYDLNGIYADGCECMDDAAAHSCGAALNMGAVSRGGRVTHTGNLIPGDDDWFRVSFPQSGRPGAGTPRIRISGLASGPNPFRIEVQRSCGTRYSCGSGGSADSETEFSFVDNASTPGVNQWSTTRTSWPSTAYVRVFRTSAAANCANAAYRLEVTR